MSFDFFKNSIEIGASQLPRDSIRDLQQAAIDQEFDCTSAKYTVKEQDDFGSDIYHDIEVWIDYIVGMTSRGTANGDDFRKLFFRSIDHPVKRGLYYQFDDNTWITYFTDEYASLAKDIGVRRCNNVMRIVDPENGSIFSIPCVVEYDMTSPTMQVTNSILTSNNHATVMVQGNKDTIRLFKLNTRYIIGGRPFKLLAYQNALINKSISDNPTLLYLELFLDELHDNDLIEFQLADNGEYNYTIAINSDDMNLTKDSTGELNVTITLNGQEVNRKVVWESSNDSIVKIDNNGCYKVIGKINQNCDIFVYLEGNKDINSSIKINIVESEEVVPKIIIKPLFNKIRQYESIDFEIQVNYGSSNYTPNSSFVSLAKDKNILSNEYITIIKNNNKYNITANNISKDKQILYIQANNDSPKFEITSEFPIEVVSMMG